jgi:hypothetical protein
LLIIVNIVKLDQRHIREENNRNHNHNIIYGGETMFLWPLFISVRYRTQDQPESRFQSRALLYRGRLLFHTENAESWRPIYSLLFGPEHRETRQNDKSVLFLRFDPASRLPRS